MISLSKNISNTNSSGNDKHIPTQSNILNSIKNELNSIFKNKIKNENENSKIVINLIINQIKETVELKLK